MCTRRTLAAIAIGLSLLAPQTGAAQNQAINLLRQCEGREPASAPELGLLACASYLAGFIDMHSIAEAYGASTGFCMPRQGIQNEQAVRVYVKWANDHPEKLHESARLSVLWAMSDAFPCEQAAR